MVLATPTPPTSSATAPRPSNSAGEGVLGGPFGGQRVGGAADLDQAGQLRVDGGRQHARGRPRSRPPWPARRSTVGWPSKPQHRCGRRPSRPAPTGRAPGRAAAGRRMPITVNQRSPIQTCGRLPPGPARRCRAGRRPRSRAPRWGTLGRPALRNRPERTVPLIGRQQVGPGGQHGEPGAVVRVDAVRCGARSAWVLATALAAVTGPIRRDHRGRLLGQQDRRLLVRLRLGACSRLVPSADSCGPASRLAGRRDADHHDHRGDADGDAQRGQRPPAAGGCAARAARAAARRPGGRAGPAGVARRTSLTPVPARRCVVRDDPAVADLDPAGQPRGDVPVVGDDRDGGALRVQLVQQVQHRLRRWRSRGRRSARRPAAARARRPAPGRSRPAAARRRRAGAAGGRAGAPGRPGPAPRSAERPAPAARHPGVEQAVGDVLGGAEPAARWNCWKTKPSRRPAARTAAGRTARATSWPAISHGARWSAGPACR